MRISHIEEANQSSPDAMQLSLEFLRKNILLPAVALFGAIWTVIEVTIGLGAKAIIYVIVLSVSLAAFLKLSPRLLSMSGKSVKVRIVNFVYFIGLLAAVLIAFFLLTSHITRQGGDNPVFSFSSAAYGKPNILIALPSFGRTLLYYKYRTCVREGRANCGDYLLDSYLSRTVPVSDEISRIFEAIGTNNHAPIISIAASWRSKEGRPEALEDYDIISIGGPITTAYFFDLREKIIEKLTQAGVETKVLPIDFSEKIYRFSLSHSDEYKDERLYGLVLHVKGGPRGRVRLIEQQAAFSEHCLPGNANYWFPSLPKNATSTIVESRKFEVCGRLGSQDDQGQNNADDLLRPQDVSPDMSKRRTRQEQEIDYEIDHAFVILGPNPFNSKRRLVLAAGTHSEATAEALTFLLDLTREEQAELAANAVDLDTGLGYLTVLIRSRLYGSELRYEHLKSIVF